LRNAAAADLNVRTKLFDVGPTCVSRQFQRIDCALQIASRTVEPIIALRADLVLMRHHAEQQLPFPWGHGAAIFVQIVAASRLKLLHGSRQTILHLVPDRRLRMNVASDDDCEAQLKRKGRFANKCLHITLLPEATHILKFRVVLLT
jgi:hypothetical protein